MEGSEANLMRKNTNQDEKSHNITQRSWQIKLNFSEASD
jgi:hypothetical protein